MHVSIDIDPTDFFSDHSDALDAIEGNNPAVAVAILREALGQRHDAKSDPETARRMKLIGIFHQWVAAGKPAAFWEWSHGKRHMS